MLAPLTGSRKHTISIALASMSLFYELFLMHDGAGRLRPVDGDFEASHHYVVSLGLPALKVKKKNQKTKYNFFKPTVNFQKCLKFSYF